MSVGGQMCTSSSEMYCLGCGYNLGALRSARCPECGRPFDLADSGSYSITPSRARWSRILLLVRLFIGAQVTFPCTVAAMLLLWQIKNNDASVWCLYVGVCVAVAVLFRGLMGRFAGKKRGGRRMGAAIVALALIANTGFERCPHA